MGHSISKKNIHVLDSVDPLITAWDLGSGESEVLSYCHQHSNCEAIIDDRTARKCAETLSIPVRGTLGVILTAKKHGLINKALPLVNKLTEFDYRIHPTVISTVRELLSE